MAGKFRKLWILYEEIVQLGVLIFAFTLLALGVAIMSGWIILGGGITVVAVFIWLSRSKAASRSYEGSLATSEFTDCDASGGDGGDC